MSKRLKSKSKLENPNLEKIKQFLEEVYQDSLSWDPSKSAGSDALFEEKFLRQQTKIVTKQKNKLAYS